jgi:SAM-dependent methyltransferase
MNEDFISQYEPQLPLDQLVVELNKIYHAFEARDYDTKHPEVHQQLPSLWAEMISIAKKLNNREKLCILDYGCGTGFEASQIAQFMQSEQIGLLTCYDPSQEMLEQCRKKISPLLPQADFCSDESAFLTNEQPYNLVITNSLLHHLPDPVKSMQALLPVLDKNTVWLAGHEPSSRFYKNSECLRAYEEFLKDRKWRRFFSKESYLGRLKMYTGLTSSPASQTAYEALKRGLFKHKPSARIVGLLVDFHVAHSSTEAASGRGFDFQEMQQKFSSWHLVWVKTYSFMGSFYEGRLPQKWLAVSEELSRLYPQDGANFCSVWRNAP